MIAASSPPPFALPLATRPGASPSIRLGPPPALWPLYEQLDTLRRWQGRILDAAGFGPQQCPPREVLRRPGYNLQAYAPAQGAGPPIVIVPAPIKPAYVWDLAPGSSVVEACLAAGLRPYVVWWDSPAPEFGLAAYADRFLAECLDAVAAETGQARAILAAHSLGGLFAAAFAARHPERVAALALIAAPLNFGFEQEDGALGPIMAALGRARWLERAPAGNLPGSFLSLAGFLAAPAAFGQERIVDWLRSLPDRSAAGTHMRVERWTLDERPLARRLVEELVERVYPDNALMTGRLALESGCPSPRGLTAPLLTVADAGCPVVPPRSQLPFHAAAASREKQLLWYGGDTGVGIRHIGPLVGRSAHRELWPQILAWLSSRAGG
jgi:polyhydroxyalkanoate synthase